MNEDSVFETSFEFPDPDFLRRYHSLVGIDEQKTRLGKGLGAILDPPSVEAWFRRHYSEHVPILSYLEKRPPLFVLAGDVGTGKTALAESVGAYICSVNRLEALTLYRMSLSSRGSGLVGEMTKLVHKAFEEFGSYASKLRSSSDEKARSACLLLIDEADALAQSRETAQMHHEDRAGVNALIRGIDDLASRRAPAAVIMCTNRIGALDPAVRRRAADIIEFRRPSESQRLDLLSQGLSGLGLSKDQIAKLASLTGGSTDGNGFTYADLTDRFLPNLVLKCYPDQAITFDAALELAESLRPTPNFKEG